MPDSALFGGEELPVVGQDVVAITLDSNVVIFAGDHREHEFRIGNTISLATDGNGPVTVRYDPYAHSGPVIERITELAAIVSRKITYARAYMTGRLELIFDPGATLVVEPMPRYEAWAYTCDEYILACPPGDSKHERAVVAPRHSTWRVSNRGLAASEMIDSDTSCAPV